MGVRGLNEMCTPSSLVAPHQGHQPGWALAMSPSGATSAACCGRKGVLNLQGLLRAGRLSLTQVALGARSGACAALRGWFPERGSLSITLTAGRSRKCGGARLCRPGSWPQLLHCQSRWPRAFWHFPPPHSHHSAPQGLEASCLGYKSHASSNFVKIYELLFWL